MALPPAPIPPPKSGSGPLAVFQYRAASAAQNFAGRFAKQAKDLGYDGVAEWAQRHVWGTFVGCSGLVLTLAFALLAAGYGALTSDTSAATPSASMARTSAVLVSPPAVVDPSALAPGEERYKIVRNDVLSTIARDEGVTVEALVARNAALLARWQKDCEDTTTRDPSTCLYTIRRDGEIVIPASPAQ